MYYPDAVKSCYAANELLEVAICLYCSQFYGLKYHSPEMNAVYLGEIGMARW